MADLPSNPGSILPPAGAELAGGSHLLVGAGRVRPAGRVRGTSNFSSRKNCLSYPPR